MARRKVKRRLQFKRLQKQHRIANPYKKQKDSTALHTQAAVQDEAQMVVEDDDDATQGNSKAETLPPFAENQPATRRSLLLRQAADKKRLQLIVKTLRARRKKMKRANKEQKKQLSRRIKELTANLRNKHARELEETRLVDSASSGEGPSTGGIPSPQDAGGCKPKAPTAPSSAPTVEAEEDSWIDVVPRKGSRQKKGRARRAAKAAAKLTKSSCHEGADDDINAMEVDDCSSDDGLEKVQDCEL